LRQSEWCFGWEGAGWRPPSELRQTSRRQSRSYPELLMCHSDPAALALPTRATCRLARREQAAVPQRGRTGPRLLRIPRRELRGQAAAGADLSLLDTAQGVQGSCSI